jgi:hypothetical protein
MKQKHTQAKKARRVNLWTAYQKWIFGLSVFERRVRGYEGADSRSFSEKHHNLDAAVEGMKQRLAQQGQHRKV